MKNNICETSVHQRKADLRPLASWRKDGHFSLAICTEVHHAQLLIDADERTGCNRKWVANVIGSIRSEINVQGRRRLIGDGPYGSMVVHRACALSYGSKNFFCGAPPKRPTAGISISCSPGIIARGNPGPFGMNNCG